MQNPVPDFRSPCINTNSQMTPYGRNFLICTGFPGSTLRSLYRLYPTYLAFYHLILKDSTLGGGQKVGILYPHLTPLLSSSFLSASPPLVPRMVWFPLLSCCIKFCSFPYYKIPDITCTFKVFQIQLKLTNILFFLLKRPSSWKWKTLWLSKLSFYHAFQGSILELKSNNCTFFSWCCFCVLPPWSEKL